MGLTSPTHLIILLVIILLLFGARKIPELAKGLGQGMREFKKGVNDNDELEKSDGSSDAKSENRTNSAAADSEAVREEARESVNRDTASH